MEKLTREDLFSLEQYSEKRADFRAEVLAHKAARKLPIGPNATLYFEDRLTMQYQIQEMLRIEKIFEADAIQEELDAYNPLIPDGSNWKATFMLEYPEIEQRRQALGQLMDIENQVWVRVADFEPVYAIADEDLDRADEGKTSSVHFLRFELSPEMVRAIKSGSAVEAGISHPNYSHSCSPIPAATRDSLAQDLG